MPRARLPRSSRARRCASTGAGLTCGLPRVRWCRSRGCLIHNSQGQRHNGSRAHHAGVAAPFPCRSRPQTARPGGRPNRLPLDPRQPAGRGLVGLRRQPRDELLEVAREARAVAGERDALHVHAVLGAAQPPQPRVNLKPPAAQIEMAARPRRDAGGSHDGACSTSAHKATTTARP